MTTATQPSPRGNRNARFALAIFTIPVAMLGAAYAAVPLYEMFCQVTGFGGTTQIAAEAPRGTLERAMTVRFDSNVNRALSWKVAAAHPVTDDIGTVETVVYTATNTSDVPLTGTATFNVTPEIAGGYFNKMECFCFTEQLLQPGETVEMPVTFFVDPAIADDPNLDTVREITLSYTFYAADKDR